MVDETLLAQAQAMIEQINQLQGLASREAWEDFTDEAEKYTRQFNLLCDAALPRIDVTTDPEVISGLRRLLNEDRMLKQLIQVRMNELSRELGATRRSQQTVSAYNAV